MVFKNLGKMRKNNCFCHCSIIPTALLCNYIKLLGMKQLKVFKDELCRRFMILQSGNICYLSVNGNKQEKCTNLHTLCVAEDIKKQCPTTTHYECLLLSTVQTPTYSSSQLFSINKRKIFLLQSATLQSPMGHIAHQFKSINT